MPKSTGAQQVLKVLIVDAPPQPMSANTEGQVYMYNSISCFLNYKKYLLTLFCKRYQALYKHCAIVCVHAESLQLCLPLCDPIACIDCNLPGSPCPWESPDKNIEVACHALFQGIFLTQGSNPCLLRLLH